MSVVLRTPRVGRSFCRHPEVSPVRSVISSHSLTSGAQQWTLASQRRVLTAVAGQGPGPPAALLWFQKGTSFFFPEIIQDRRPWVLLSLGQGLSPSADRQALPISCFSCPSQHLPGPTQSRTVVPIFALTHAQKPCVLAPDLAACHSWTDAPTGAFSGLGRRGQQERTEA